MKNMLMSIVKCTSWFVLQVALTIYVCWDFIHDFLPSADFFSKNSFRNTIRLSNSLDPDQAPHFVGPDLDVNWLQRLSADEIELRVN